MFQVYFYKLTSFDGYSVSVTDLHYLVVIDENNNIKTLPAYKITMNHQLLTMNRSLKIKSIEYIVQIGYYSPITLSGYLLVNNISTSVYSNMYVNQRIIFFFFR